MRFCASQYGIELIIENSEDAKALLDVEKTGKLTLEGLSLPSAGFEPLIGKPLAGTTRRRILGLANRVG